MSPDNHYYNLPRYNEYGSEKPSYFPHIVNFLSMLISRHRSGTIVDFGAGTAIYSNKLKLPGFNTVAQDISPDAFDSIGVGVNPHYGDIDSLSIYSNIIAWHVKDVIVDHIPIDSFFMAIRELSPIGTLVMLTTLNRYEHRKLEAVPRGHGFEAIRKDEWTPTPSEGVKDWYKIERKTRSIFIYERSR